MKNIYPETVSEIYKCVYKLNIKKLIIVVFIFCAFSILFGVFNSSNGNLIVSYANTDVQVCGCSKCHTIELNGCYGCHNTQQGNGKLDRQATDSGTSSSLDSSVNDNDTTSEDDLGETQDSSQNLLVPQSEDEKPNSDTSPLKERQKKSNDTPQK